MHAKPVLVIVALLVLFSIIVIYWLAILGPSAALNNGPSLLNSKFHVGEIMVGNSTYYAYIADTTSLQQEGYMNETGIGDCGQTGRQCLGMLFVFGNDSAQCFWMKNTYFALKQSWISNGKVSYVYDAVPLSTNVICSNGSMVLETNASFDIRPGENLTFLAYSK